MPKLRKLFIKTVRTAGYVSLAFILGFLALKIIGAKYQDHVLYERTNLNDGPYIFWLEDSAFKAVDITFC